MQVEVMYINGLDVACVFMLTSSDVQLYHPSDTVRSGLKFTSQVLRITGLYQTHFTII